MTVGIDSSVLLGWYQSYFNGTGTGVPSATSGTGTASAATAQYAPTPPWSQTTKPAASQLVQTALSGANIVNPNAAKLDLPSAADSADYKNLFALYQGLQTLYDVASQAKSANTSSFQLSQLSAAFTSGLSQVEQFASSTSFNKLRLTTGATASTETSTSSTQAQSTSYQTVALNTTGDSAAVVPAFQGDVQFDVNVQAGSSNTTIHMNLADMGSTPRTMGNVVAYLNSQMTAGGAIASFSTNAIAPQPDVINVGGSSVTVSDGQPSWGLQLNTNPYETVTLSAASTAPAVYIGEMVGNQNASIAGDGTTVAPDAQSQLLKLQAGTATVTAPDPGAHAVAGQVFEDSLGAPVTSIQQTAVAPDGSVYVLADVSTPATGSSTAASQDVALLKYDSAGNLLFQNDLGSASAASGLSLAVSADGTQVAVAGQVTGPLTTGLSLENPTGSNSFVAVYDSLGDQVWNQEQNGISGNQANGVAFGADGSVYVTGQSAATVGAALTPTAASSAYLTVYSPAGQQLSNTQFGGAGVNAGTDVAVDGTNVYVASTQNGHAVVSEYDVSTPSAPTLIASRDLGDLQNGGIAGLAVQDGTVYVAGSTHDGALAAGTVTSAYSGTGLNVFAATLSTGLAPASTDAIAYYGGSGDTTATGMSVSNGEVYLTGSATGSLPGQAAIGAQDGYAAALNVAAGTVDWSQRFTGLDGQVAPTSIAVAPTGASILDQLGLPQGVVDGPVSDLLTAGGAVKTGDSFGISAGGGTTTITIAAGETMASLSEKIAQATGYQVSVSLQASGSSSRLQIAPLDPFATVTLVNGPAASNALEDLGLKAGILYDSTTKKGVTTPTDGKAPIYGLGLDSTLNLGSATDIGHAMSQLTAAMSVIKSAYQTLQKASTPANVLALQTAQASGAGVPAYLTAQISNYQAALSRLTAGSSSTGTAATSILGSLT